MTISDLLRQTEKDLRNAIELRDQVEAGLEALSLQIRRVGLTRDEKDELRSQIAGAQDAAMRYRHQIEANTRIYVHLLDARDVRVGPRP